MPHSFPTRRSSDLARPAPPRGDDPPAGRTGGDIRQGSAREIAFLAKVADQDRREVRVSPGGEHGDAVPGGPEHETGQPLLKPEADCGGDRAVDDGDPARWPAEPERRPGSPVGGILHRMEEGA